MNIENSDILEWYIYETLDNNKKCYDTWNGAMYEFDLTDKKDLYNFLIHNYSEIQNKKVYENNDTLEQNIPLEIDQDTLNIFNEIFGTKDEQ